MPPATQPKMRVLLGESETAGAPRYVPPSAPAGNGCVAHCVALFGSHEKTAAGVGAKMLLLPISMSRSPGAAGVGGTMTVAGPTPGAERSKHDQVSTLQTMSRPPSLFGTRDVVVANKRRPTASKAADTTVGSGVPELRKPTREAEDGPSPASMDRAVQLEPSKSQTRAVGL